MSEMNRREFAEALAMAALAPMLPGAVVSLPLTATVATDEPAALARALAGAIRAQYGERLSDEDLAAITRQIESSLERVARVRKVPLTNADEPDFVFSVVRPPELG
jgi:hypothetical protein